MGSTRRRTPQDRSGQQHPPEDGSATASVAPATKRAGSAASPNAPKWFEKSPTNSKCGANRVSASIRKVFALRFVLEAIDEDPSRADQDIVVDCTGSPDGVNVAMQMVRPRGTIVLKTTVAAPSNGDGAAVDLTPLVVNEIQLIGSRCGPFVAAMNALSAGDVDVVSLISRRMKLADGVEALKMADQPDTIKVLLEP